MEQVIDKAITAITETGLYHTALLEWNGFDPANQTWPELKSHFTEAYDLLQRSGAGTSAAHGYHQGNWVQEADDDNSVGSIRSSLTNIHQAHNANTVAINDNLSAITTESALQQKAIEALQQQVALLTVNPPPVPTPAPYSAPSAYHTPPAAPTHAPPPPAQPYAAYAATVAPPPPPYIPVTPPAYYQHAQQYCRGGRGGRGGGVGVEGE